jgi:glucan biosynthesis protein C
MAIALPPVASDRLAPRPSGASHPQRFDRRPDIDWLRVAAVLLLLPFHSARVFDVLDPFYTKSTELSVPLSYLVQALNPWHMPLLFALAGMSSFFALRKRSAAAFGRERALRLGIPLVFGLAVLVPPQGYLGLLTHGGRADSMIAYWPSFFRVDPTDLSGYYGAFTPAHLWFILFLLMFSLVALPLVARWRTPRWETEALARLCETPGGIFLFTVPLAIANQVELGGKPMLSYLLVYLLGYLVVADVRLQRAVDRHASSALGLGLITMGLYLLAMTMELRPSAGSIGAWLVRLLWAANTWLWVIGLLGLAHRSVHREGRVLAYASQAAYPVYLVHQTIIVVVAFFVLQQRVPVALAFLWIMLVSGWLSLVAYELVRRTPLTRLLFGLRAHRPESTRSAARLMA